MTDKTKIKVIGVGGAGLNTVSRMIKNGLTGVEFWVMNTDIQLLEASDCENKLQLGKKTTKGLGSGGDPQIGEKAAKETEQDIKEALKGADMVFIVAGFGSGTGTGATPVIAKIAKDMGILTIAFVTKPFTLEGRERQEKADQVIKGLKEVADAIAVIPNDKLLQCVDKQISLTDAFRIVDNTLLQFIRSISAQIIKPGIIHVEFKHIKEMLQNVGQLSIGFGQAKGENRAVNAAKMALNLNSLETSIKYATSVLIIFKGSPDITIREIYYASRIIKAVINDDANIMICDTVDDNLQDEINVTVIATGFDN